MLALTVVSPWSLPLYCHAEHLLLVLFLPSHVSIDTTAASSSSMCRQVCYQISFNCPVIFCFPFKMNVWGNNVVTNSPTISKQDRISDPTSFEKVLFIGVHYHYCCFRTKADANVYCVCVRNESRLYTINNDTILTRIFTKMLKVW